jgi:hypothetical protein
MNMDMQTWKIPAVIRVDNKDGVYLEAEGYPFPAGPTVRVRDVWRDPTILPESFSRQRAIVMEILRPSGGWLELASSTYLDICERDDGKVAILSPGFGRRTDRRNTLIEQAKMRVADMIEQGFGMSD